MISREYDENLIVLEQDSSGAPSLHERAALIPVSGRRKRRERNSGEDCMRVARP